MTLTETFRRQLDATVSTDLAGLIGAGVVAPPPIAAQWPAVAILRTPALDGLAGATPLPLPLPLDLAPMQPNEKDLIGSRSITLDTQTANPQTAALATNLSGRAEGARGWIESYLAAAVANAIDNAVIGKLNNAAGATPSGDLTAALSAVVQAGWRRIAVVIGTAGSGLTDMLNLASLGIDVVFDPNATPENYVIGRSGVSLAVNDVQIVRGPDEPSLVGSEVGAWAAIDIAVAPGAVAYWTTS